MAAEIPSILILGCAADPHVARVAHRLRARARVEVVVLDFLEPTPCAIEMTDRGHWTLHVGDRSLSEAHLLWDRVKFLPHTDLYPRGDRVASDYAAKEWSALYDTICALCEGRVINGLDARRQLKPQQRALAARAGFFIPPSLVASSKPAILAFHATRRNTIVKSLSAERVLAHEHGGRDYNLLTMRVNAEDVQNATEAQFSHCPHFFQAEIEKNYELRVVWVGTRAVAFRIDSQARALTQVDWRNGIRTVHCERVELDATLERRLHDFMLASGLFTGSVDLIVDRKDRTWFLEVNQIGQWTWLDDLSDGAVSDLFAEELEARALASRAA
jgi:hypothetical protein